MGSTGIEIATALLDDFTEAKVKDILDLKPWMKECTFSLLTKQVEIEDYITECIEKGLCSLDLETTGLNTRVVNGESGSKIVGVCMAHDIKEGVYIPVAHDDKEYNVPLNFMIRELKRLTTNCVCVYHNFKYDGALLRNYGIICEDENMYEDTLLLAAIEDASRKQKGLKFLSESLLNRPSIEIGELGIQGNKKNVVAFSLVPPPKAVYYGGSDAINTLALWYVLKDRMDKQDPDKKSGPWFIYDIEKKCQFVTMEMERNTVKIDRPYLKKEQDRVLKRLKDIEDKIYEIVGHKFDIRSPKQLGNILFDELKLQYPIKEKSATGQYITREKVLEKLQNKYPIVDLILRLRGMEKIKGTYIENFLKNADENDEVKFQLNQVRADTGRYSSTGGDGIHEDGYSGVNCQNIPAVYSDPGPDSVNLRKALIAHSGFKIVSIDYSGEELRIATNFSDEPKWVEEFLHGSADLHTITGQIIHQKNVISRKERGTGKTLNFLTLYGGGAGGFAQQAKIPYETAKRMIFNFFKDYKGLKKWIDKEHKLCRQRGFSRTAFGRRRSLTEFYNSTDKGIQAKGDRLAINSKVQGTGADVIKIALFRVWRWIRENGFQDDIRILMPIHDEIIYEIREDKLDFFIPELCKIMCLRDITDKLGWKIPLEVDAEYGDTLHVDRDYWKEYNEQKKEIEDQVKTEDTCEEIKEKSDEFKNLRSTVNDEAENLIKETAARKQKLSETVIINELKQVQNSVGDRNGGCNKSISEDGSELEMELDSCKTSNTGSTCYYSSVTIKNILGEKSDRNEIEKVFKSQPYSTESCFEPTDIQKRIDSSGYFNYTLNVDPITAYKIKTALQLLDMCDNDFFVGPRYKICFMDSKGFVLHKTPELYPIDAFLAYCVLYNI